MGYMAHDAVIVTISGYVLEPRDGRPAMPDVEAFRISLPAEWQALIVGPAKSITNDYLTYAFLPDGSKEGWGTSNAGDEYREQFADLFAFKYDDGSSPFNVVHVRFGGDDYEHPTVTARMVPAAGNSKEDGS